MQLAIESHDYSCGIHVFPDFSKAFDTVNHQILLRKLDYYGIRGAGFPSLFSDYANMLQSLIY